MHRSAGEVERLYTDVAAEYGAALERLARAYERDADVRRDLLQEIHVALWRSLARFDGRCSMRTWVYRVAHNIATSRVIRAKKSATSFAELAMLESIPDKTDGEAQFDRRRTLDRVWCDAEPVFTRPRSITGAEPRHSRLRYRALCRRGVAASANRTATHARARRPRLGSIVRSEQGATDQCVQVPDFVIVQSLSNGREALPGLNRQPLVARETRECSHQALDPRTRGLGM